MIHVVPLREGTKTFIGDTPNVHPYKKRYSGHRKKIDSWKDIGFYFIKKGIAADCRVF